jgi:hypothetical protein
LGLFFFFFFFFEVAEFLITSTLVQSAREDRSTIPSC